MTSQTYSTRSNAKRAAEKALGPHNYTLRQIGSVWTFEPCALAEPAENEGVEGYTDVAGGEPSLTVHADELASPTGAGERNEGALLSVAALERDPSAIATKTKNETESEPQNAGTPGHALSNDSAPEKPKQRAGTKQALLIEMLSRPEGATMPEIMEATGWLSHTVRGAMAGALKKRLGLTIGSDGQEGRGRAYRIVS